MREVGGGGGGGGGGVGGEIFGVEKGVEKSMSKGRGCVLIHPQNGLNNFILNWCICGC